MRMRSRLAAGAISLLIYLAIFLLSSLPARSLPAHIPDIIPHFLEYAALAFFLIQAFPRPGRGPGLAAAVFVLAVLGLLDEWHQLSASGRVFSLLDLLWDMLGALAGMAFFRFLLHRSAGNGGGRISRCFNFLLLQR